MLNKDTAYISNITMTYTLDYGLLYQKWIKKASSSGNNLSVNQQFVYFTPSAFLNWDIIHIP